MDAKDLRIFKAVYEERSINKASQSIFMSAQGVGKIIQKLETELGAELFTRKRSGVLPTKQGDILYAKASEIADILDSLYEDFEGRKGKNLNIAFSYGVLPYVGMAMMQKFRTENPDIECEYREETDEKVEGLFGSGDIQVGIIGAPLDISRYEAFPFFSCRHVAIVNKQHPLAKKDVIEYQDLEGETLVLVGRQFHPYHNNRNRFAKAGVRPKELIEISEIANTHIFAANNVGIGVSVDFVAQQTPHVNTVTIPFADKSCTWDTYLVYPKGSVLKDEAKRFVEFSLAYRDTKLK